MKTLLYEKDRWFIWSPDEVPLLHTQSSTPDQAWALLLRMPVTTSSFEHIKARKIRDRYRAVLTTMTLKGH